MTGVSHWPKSPSAHLYKRFDKITAVNDLNLDIKDREFMVLVGPSGCGKTTALRMIAGLEEVSDGDIKIGERVVNTRLPQRPGHRHGLPELRPVPAHDRLRQHGLRPEAPPRPQARHRQARRARPPGCSGIEALLQRRPGQLSGGQRQRVALGRAIVREPQVFLMDEPLSNLDAKLRVQTRAELIKLHRRLGITTIYVTHDQVEAMTMGDRIAVMTGGGCSSARRRWRSSRTRSTCSWRASSGRPR